LTGWTDGPSSMATRLLWLNNKLPYLTR